MKRPSMKIEIIANLTHTTFLVVAAIMWRVDIGGLPSLLWLMGLFTGMAGSVVARIIVDSERSEP